MTVSGVLSFLLLLLLTRYIHSADVLHRYVCVGCMCMLVVHYYITTLNIHVTPYKLYLSITDLLIPLGH